jgi:hypothetical protein
MYGVVCVKFVDNLTTLPPEVGIVRLAKTHNGNHHDEKRGE